MDWLLQCILCVALTSTSAYNYGAHAFRDYDHSFRSPTRRADYDPTHTIEPRTNERPTQRMNERSIAVTSGVQRVQDNERRRVQPWTEPAYRENGTYKIVNSELKYPTVTNRRGSLEERISESVVFPGRTSAQKFVPQIPRECAEIGICESIPNYPHDIVNNIIKKLGDKLDRFHVDELEEPEIAQRIGPDDNVEIDLCNHRETIIKPQAAQNKHGNWHIILNNKENPLQGYRVEICQSKEQTCGEKIATFYEGYTPICKQKYVQRSMTAVDVDKQEIIYDMPFRVPSCCSCVVIHNRTKKSKEQTCGENIAYFFEGYTPVCRQKYVQRTMAAVNVEKQQIYDMSFRVPSCCSCVAIHNPRK